MSIKSRVAAALDLAWDAQGTEMGSATEVPDHIATAMQAVFDAGDAPARQMTLTILASVAENPDSNPASLQLGGGGVDRRGEASGTVEALTAFKNAHGVKLKISKDPGVSNPFREPEVNRAWVDRRRGRHRRWAEGMLTIVQWLEQAITPEERVRRATLGLSEAGRRVVQLVIEAALNYPRFQCSPRLAMRLAREFIATAPDRPDALEAVVTVAARSLARVMIGEVSVVRGDINSPDPIDIVLRDRAGAVAAGIEVTDEYLSRSKLEHEVVNAMLELGLDRATVVSRGIADSDRADIEDYVDKLHTHLGQRVDLVTVDVIESWLSFPGAPRGVATDFVWGVGEELDNFSNTGNRRAWYNVLAEYAKNISD